LEVLELSRRSSVRRLADVQAGIILMFLLFHGEGFSTRTRCLFVSNIAMARDLCLHKLDAPTTHTIGSDLVGFSHKRDNLQAEIKLLCPYRRSPDTPSHERSILETEIKRRVWWHIVATDWLMSMGGSPLDGTYYIQARHMRVNVPLHCEDADLEQGNEPVERPWSEPTITSYYIHRIRLAQLSRTIADTMPLTNYELNMVDYDDVIALDRKFEAYFESLPPFFKLVKQHIGESEPVMHQRPYLAVQRYALNMIALTRRCKLHQPFLIRHSAHHRYDYSRQVSLQSARLVIQMRDLLSIDECGPFVAISGRHTGVVYHIFMATIVLVMDLCFNKAVDGEEDVARKREVATACKMLADSKSRSVMASKYSYSIYPCFTVPEANTKDR
jgi:hypothetical protein